MRVSRMNDFVVLQRKPDWFVIRPQVNSFQDVKLLLKKHGLSSICEEAHCPNLPECWGESKTATFLLMGDTCTRACKFCYVKSGMPLPLDASEPVRLADAVVDAGFEYVVLTSVNRDDLSDGGARHFAECIRAIKRRNSDILVEVLTPDFNGDVASLKTIVDAKPDVFAHNIETVERLQRSVRDVRAGYAQSLAVLKYVKSVGSSIITKSSIMLGLGESVAEVVQAWRDLRGVGVDLLTIGQYLQPSPHHFPVREFVRPEMFEELRQMALNEGFLFVASGPFVRSSYRAGEVFVRGVLRK